MHGNPLLRLALVLVALGIVGVGVWSVTSPAAYAAPKTTVPSPAAPAATVQLTVKVTLLHLASEVHIGPIVDGATPATRRPEATFTAGKPGERGAVLSTDAPPYVCTSSMAVVLPPEGIDVPFSINWTGPETETAVRVEISDGLRTSERIFWTHTTGQFSDAVTFGAPVSP